MSSLIRPQSALVVLALLFCHLPLLAGDATGFYLLEPPAEAVAAGEDGKTIVRMGDGKLRIIYVADLVDDQGKKSKPVLEKVMDVTSDQGGIVTCVVEGNDKVVVDRKAHTIAFPQMAGTRPLKPVTAEKAAEHVGIPWIVSKQAFKKLVRKGDPVERYLVGFSAIISDHATIRLWDGTKLDVYAPMGLIRSSFVEEKRDGPMEWIIKGGD